VISPEKVIYENSFSVAGKTFENAGLVSTQVKALLRTLNLPRDVIRRVAIVTYEAEMNICSYADRGKINLRITPNKIYIEAIDEGQGIADIEVAMREGYSTATEKIWHMGFGAGMGLSNIRRFSDSFIITSEVGKGTHLRMMIRIP
jgi:anti-sigma regulatory factor (Ser/Thr protein kinase)